MSQEVMVNYKNEVINQNQAKNPVQLKGFARLFSRTPTTLHAFLYFSVMGLLTLIWAIGVSRTGLRFFWPIFAFFGWGFACGWHITLYLSYNNKIQFLSKIRQRPYFGWLFITHAWFYISISIFLIVINVLFSRFPWSAFAIIGWGIAFGFHLIIASLMEPQKKPEVKPIQTEEVHFCPNCGANFIERPDVNYCALCGT
ncbi:MAG: 2TM domain-containing protein, partial [Promethearchaeota archaeon]